MLDTWFFEETGKYKFKFHEQHEGGFGDRLFEALGGTEYIITGSWRLVDDKTRMQLTLEDFSSGAIENGIVAAPPMIGKIVQAVLPSIIVFLFGGSDCRWEFLIHIEGKDRFKFLPIDGHDPDDTLFFERIK